MTYDYFYGQQSDLFTFYRVPKVLFTNERFWNDLVVHIEKLSAHFDELSDSIKAAEKQIVEVIK